MLQLKIIQNINDYIEFFEKLKQHLPQDQDLINIINQLKNIENGCRCQRRNRYNHARTTIDNYIKNIDKNIIAQLIATYSAENFKFEPLTS